MAAFAMAARGSVRARAPKPIPKFVPREFRCCAKTVLSAAELEHLAYQLMARFLHDPKPPQPLKATMERRKVVEILHTVSDLFDADKPFVPLTADEAHPVIVVGRIGGEMANLLAVLAKYGMPPKVTYVFLGNFAGPGEYGMEVCLLLFILKIRFQQNIIILRGRLETYENADSFMHRHCEFNFKLEEFFFMFNLVFDQMPLAALVNAETLCTSSGISQWQSGLRVLNDLSCTMERTETLANNLMTADMLYGKPTHDDGTGFPPCAEYGRNFDYSVFKAYLKANVLKRVIRGNDFIEKGYEFSYPDCITLSNAMDGFRTMTVAVLGGEGPQRVVRLIQVIVPHEPKESNEMFKSLFERFPHKQPKRSTEPRMTKCWNCQQRFTLDVLTQRRILRFKDQEMWIRTVGFALLNELTYAKIIREKDQHRIAEIYMPLMLDIVITKLDKSTRLVVAPWELTALETYKVHYGEPAHHHSILRTFRRRFNGGSLTNVEHLIAKKHRYDDEEDTDRDESAAQDGAGKSWWDRFSRILKH